LPDGSTDVVTCSYLLHLLDPADRRAVLAEARRLLAPTGASRLVVVSTWSDPATPGGRLVQRATTALSRRWPARLGGLMPCDPTPELEAAGFFLTHRVHLPRGGYPSLALRARLA